MLNLLNINQNNAIHERDNCGKGFLLKQTTMFRLQQPGKIELATHRNWLVLILHGVCARLLSWQH